MNTDRRITISIVSHRQNALVNRLIEDLARVCAERIVVVVTENVADAVALATQSLACPVERIVNPRLKGFGGNHNAAFARCSTAYFCVANPDIRLPADPFPVLLESLQQPRAAVAGPLVRSPTGAVEDSARRFPTARILVRKALHGAFGPDYPHDRGALEVDWVAGMFMLFKSAAFRQVRGFDERYFLYYEDVDICRRLQVAGKSVVYDPRAEVIHDARRASRREFRLALRHVSSALRFLRG